MGDLARALLAKGTVTPALSKSRNVTRALKAQWRVIYYRILHEQAKMENEAARNRLTGGQLGEFNRLLPSVVADAQNGVNPFKRKETA